MITTTNYLLKATRIGLVSVTVPAGCPMIIKLGSRAEHEKDCEYCPVQCPNSSNCSVVLKKDLAEHLLNCKHVRCPHHRYK